MAWPIYCICIGKMFLNELVEWVLNANGENPDQPVHLQNLIGSSSLVTESLNIVRI